MITSNPNLLGQPEAILAVGSDDWLGGLAFVCASLAVMWGMGALLLGWRVPFLGLLYGLRRECATARLWMLYFCHRSFDVFNCLGLTFAVRLLQLFTYFVKVNDALFCVHNRCDVNPPNEKS